MEETPSRPSKKSLGLRSRCSNFISSDSFISTINVWFFDIIICFLLSSGRGFSYLSEEFLLMEMMGWEFRSERLRSNLKFLMQISGRPMFLTESGGYVCMSCKFHSKKSHNDFPRNFFRIQTFKFPQAKNRKLILWYKNKLSRKKMFSKSLSHNKSLKKCLAIF